MGRNERWRVYIPPPQAETTAPVKTVIPEDCSAVSYPATASVWRVSVALGQRVEAGEGIVERLFCVPAGIVLAGQNLVLIRRETA